MNIKDYREKELKTLVIANVLVILCLTDFITFEGVVEQNSYMQLIITIINSGLFASIIFAVVTVCDCMISSEIKKIIVFWRSPMPGETVFSDIKDNNKDERFTTSEVLDIYKDVYNNFPEEKKSLRQYENSKWYSILRQYESETKVLIAQRDYLLCRDIASTTVLMGISYVMISCLIKLFPFDVKALAYLAGVYIVCIVAARVKAKRFVNTVIACDVYAKRN